MSNDRLIYLPLGGAGEIGMNCYLYGYGPAGKERFIMVDLGLTFPDMDTTPGVDLILPDIEWIEKRRDRLDAIFITHAHEDHVGAVGHLWGHLKAPIYARSFTAHMARLKFEEAGHDELMIKTAPVFPDMIEAGAFKVGFAPISHSIPESSALGHRHACGPDRPYRRFQTRRQSRRRRGLGSRPLVQDRQTRRQGAGLRFHERVLAAAGTF